MHPNDQLLRATLDGEEIDPAAREHIATCPDCQARMETIAARANRVQSRLDALAPLPGETGEPASRQ